MTIEEFKELTHEQKLNELKHNGELLGPYLRNGDGMDKPKTPGDIFALYEFWVFLSEDESMVIPSRKNILLPKE
ncbi:MAG: hypothetical protein JWN76_1921 [Chitinophagaceae bacterium]|nr:hypothetical protein [Chitinophagaceae bacterium]